MKRDQKDDPSGNWLESIEVIVLVVVAFGGTLLESQANIFQSGVLNDIVTACTGAGSRSLGRNS